MKSKAKAGDHTYSVSFAEMASDHVVHVVVLTQVQLQQIDFHFTMFHKHAMLNHLEKIEKVQI